jgi:hypothetical protein
MYFVPDEEEENVAQPEGAASGGGAGSVEEEEEYVEEEEEYTEEHVAQPKRRKGAAQPKHRRPKHRKAAAQPKHRKAAASGGGGGGATASAAAASKKRQRSESGGNSSDSDQESDDDSSDSEEEVGPSGLPPSSIPLSEFCSKNYSLTALPPMSQAVADELETTWFPKFGFQKAKQRGTAQPPLVLEMSKDPGVVGVFMRSVFEWVRTQGGVGSRGFFFSYNRGNAPGAEPTGWHVDNFTEPVEGQHTVGRLVCYWGQESAALALRDADGSQATITIPPGAGLFASSELLSTGSCEHAHASTGVGYTMVIDVRGSEDGAPFQLPPSASAAALSAAASAQPRLTLSAFNPAIFKGPNRMWGQTGGGSIWRLCMSKVWGPKGKRRQYRWQARQEVGGMSPKEREEMAAEVGRVRGECA